MSWISRLTREGDMQKVVAALALLPLLGATSRLHAQTTIDVSKITCEQFVLFKVKDPDKIAIWLSGYYHGQRNSMTLEAQDLDENAKKLMDFCRGNLKMSVVDAVQRSGLTK